MKFIEMTTDAGAVIEVPDSKFSYLLREPMQPTYILGLETAIMKIDNTVMPFEGLKMKLLESDAEFVLFPIPEGTDALVNPKHILFITSIEINITAIMFNGGLKVVVKEGINTVRDKLTGKKSSIILEG